MLWRSPSPARHPPGFIEPCLPTLGHAVPSGSQWVHEIKHDGYRFICRREGDRVRVFSRGGYDWTDRVPLIVKALAALRVSVTLDGEGVVCDPDGVTDFDLLRAALGRMGSRRVSPFAFDVLELDGRDLRASPWDERRKALTKLLRKAGDGMRLSEHLATRPTATRSSSTRSPWGSKESSPSAATGRSGQDDVPIGSRSRTRMRRPRSG